MSKKTIKQGKRTAQDNVKIIDKVITDKGTVNISMKAAKWIIITIIGIMFSSGGFFYGLFTNLKGQLNELKGQNKTDKIEILDKIQELKENQILDNTLKNVLQDGDIKLLFDRTNSRQDINSTYYVGRSAIKIFKPPINLSDSIS